jgi:hypothetical protein
MLATNVVALLIGGTMTLAVQRALRVRNDRSGITA